jgi:hypothetical protein
MSITKVLMSLIFVNALVFLNQHQDKLILIRAGENVNISRHILFIALVDLFSVFISTCIQIYALLFINCRLVFEEDDERLAKNIYRCQLVSVLLNIVNTLAIFTLNIALSSDRSYGGITSPMMSTAPTAIFLNIVFIGLKVAPFHFSHFVYIPCYVVTFISFLCLTADVLTYSRTVWMTCDMFDFCYQYLFRLD